MRYIKLMYDDREMFDTAVSEPAFVFYYVHREAFKQMWREQGKQFWIRFILTFRSCSSHFGIISLMSAKHWNFTEIVDWFFIKLHEIFVDGTQSDAKQLLEDIVLVCEKRHLLRNLQSKSFARDPFCLPETRDVFRRLFGKPAEIAYIRVFTAFPLYEMFGGALCSCLRRWIDAPDMDPDDTSYWSPPPPPTLKKPEQEHVKKKVPVQESSKDSSKSKLVSSVSRETLMDSVELALEKERRLGKTTGPSFLKYWPANRDPRFFDPSNPLYDPAARRDTDWRENLDVESFLKFTEYVAKHGKRLSGTDSKLDEQSTTEEPSKPFKSTRDCCCPGHDSSILLPSGQDVLENTVQQLNSLSIDINTKSGQVKMELLQVNIPSTPDSAAKNIHLTATRNQLSRKQMKKLKKLSKVLTCDVPADKKTDSTAAMEIPKNVDDGVSGGKMANGCVKTNKCSHDCHMIHADETKQSSEVNMVKRSETTDKDLLEKKTSGSSPSDCTMDKSTNKVDTESVANAESVLPIEKNDTADHSSIVTTSESKEQVCSAESLRTCSGCAKLEAVMHEFKKCKKCKDAGLKDPKYYCSRDCQVSDWNTSHRQEHRQLQLAALMTSAS